MIKTSDFARENGVTPRAVRKLLQTYETELEGHFERKGQSGTWIDDEAQSFLRSKMVQTPIVLYNDSTSRVYDENEELKERVKELEGRIVEIKDHLAGAYKALSDERSKMNAVLLETQNSMVQLQLLDAAKGEAENRAAALADENKTLTRENTLLIQKKLDVELQLKATEEDLKTAEDVAEAAGQEADRAKARAAELELEIEKMKKRNIWERIWNK